MLFSNPEHLPELEASENYSLILLNALRYINIINSVPKLTVKNVI